MPGSTTWRGECDAPSVKGINARGGRCRSQFRVAITTISSALAFLFAHLSSEPDRTARYFFFFFFFLVAGAIALFNASLNMLVSR
jgi:hypothetical protein